MTEEILTTKFNINNSYRSNFDIKSLLTLRFNDFFIQHKKTRCIKSRLHRYQIKLFGKIFPMDLFLNMITKTIVFNEKKGPLLN